MSSLTWDDLFVDAEHLDFSKLLTEWPGVVTGQIGPIGASAFGDLFFERRSGEVEKLDVLEGGVQLIAPTREEFATLMNAQHWQEQHLLSNGVALLKDRGVLRSAGQFFGFAPHPVFTGKIDWSSVMPLDAIVWNSICAQSLNGAVPSAVLETSNEPSKKPWWKLGRE
ncbi:hypothetical protein [Variovorax boronicumulans]|uniref:hypothetical protein n=1 Tax=Variovorax boronicumulans TaxID=436515 RepID=UPI001112E4B6|nr:hypothetical protein [Variovorax boronicumulans]